MWPIIVAAALGAAAGAAGAAVGLRRTAEMPVVTSTVAEARLLAVLTTDQTLVGRYRAASGCSAVWFAYPQHQQLWEVLQAGTELASPLPEGVREAIEGTPDCAEAPFVVGDHAELVSVLDSYETSGDRSGLNGSLVHHVLSDAAEQRRIGGISRTIVPATVPTFDRPLERRPVPVTPRRVLVGAAVGGGIAAGLTAVAASHAVEPDVLWWLAAVAVTFVGGAVWQATVDLHTSWVDARAVPGWLAAVVTVGAAASLIGGVVWRWQVVAVPLVLVGVQQTAALVLRKSRGLVFGLGDALLLPVLLAVPFGIATVGWDSRLSTYLVMAACLSLPVALLVLLGVGRSVTHAGDQRLSKSAAPAIPAWLVAPAVAVVAVQALPGWMWV